MAATGHYDHLWEFLQHHISVVVKIENGLGAEFGWGTPRAGGLVWGEHMNQCLDYGMVSGIHIISDGERAFSLTKEGMVTIRGNNPILTGFLNKIKIPNP